MKVYSDYKPKDRYEDLLCIRRVPMYTEEAAELGGISRDNLSTKVILDKHVSVSTSKNQSCCWLTMLMHGSNMLHRNIAEIAKLKRVHRAQQRNVVKPAYL